MKNRAWIYSLIAIVCLVVYCTAVLIPGQKSIFRLHAELAEKQQFAAGMQRQLPSILQLEKELQQAQERVDSWRNASPQEPNLVQLLGKLAYLAEDAGIRLHRLNPQPTIPMKSLRQHPLSLTLEGEFSQLVSFLGHVEELPETIWVTQLTLTSKSENGATAQCELILTVFADNREISG
jgi:Tfp pilus assembly protein PilO